MIAELLRPGDLRTTGASEQAVRLVLEEPALAMELVEGMESQDRGLQMRASDALEKSSRVRQELLQPFASRILTVAEAAVHKELQWHCAQLLPRLYEVDLKRMEAALDRYLQSCSSIVQACAVDALAQLATKEPFRREALIAKICMAMEGGKPAVKARGKKMLTLLENRVRK